ncbi:GFA family protein [Oceanomicrobium pacificus]|uniref:GFA family protein n=1 Tax=Oceanomicrobium pacificus TaxID=2692916 RepID=A0A6B0TKQ7_9RHOB|nr:GFA family protein [Oceanomicrobium pacificus]MXU64436.1 GFA family protein [Oceanomicrobium pacificus]
MTHRGGCICGRVRYEVDGPLRPPVACHCEQCRRGSGHYTVCTSAPRDAVTITGKLSWYQYNDTASRGFCPTCGAQLFWSSTADDTLSIHMGCLDQPTGLALSGHIYETEKGDYYEIAEGRR